MKCPKCGSDTWIESFDIPVRAGPFMTEKCLCGWNSRQHEYSVTTTSNAGKGVPGVMYQTYGGNKCATPH